MTVIDLALAKRTSVVVLCAIILFLGLQSYQSLPREAEPDINIPNVFISTDYRGVNPTDIEKAVTIPIEKKLQGLENVKKITSTSSHGLSAINIEFISGTDIDDAMDKVRNKVDDAKNDLPADLEEDPKIFEVNFSELPILVLSLSGLKSLARLKEIADDLADEIEGIPGILEVNVVGGLEREIRVEPNLERLAYYKIPITALTDIIGAENRNFSGGYVTLGDGRFQVRIPGEFHSPEELLSLIIGVSDGNPVYLKDIATVIDGYKDVQELGRLNGRNAVNLSIKKRSGENIIEIIEKIDKTLSKIKPYLPPALIITKLADRSRDIHNMVADLENNLITGIILILIVIPFAMGLRNAFLVGLAIPLSMLISFIVLNAMGITLNMVVLYSLSLAVGMLVDNAIVIVENIYRFSEQGVPRLEAARLATKEVAAPVIASTITTLAVFFPLLPWPGVMGDFMRYVPITLIVTLSSSLFVAMVINPALSSLFMKAQGGNGQESEELAETLVRAGEKPAEVRGPLMKGYRWLLSWALEHRAAVVMISVLIVLLMIESWYLRVGIDRPKEFFPTVDPNGAYVNVEVPEGADLKLCDRLIRYAEMAAAGGFLEGNEGSMRFIPESYDQAMASKTHLLRSGEIFKGPSDLDNIEFLFARIIAASEMDLGLSIDTPNHVGIQFVSFDERNRSSRESVEIIRERIRHIPGATFTVAETENGPPTGAPINIEIVGDDYRVLGRIAEQVSSRIKKIPHVRDVKDNYVAGSPSIQVEINRQRAALLGLSVHTIGTALKIAFNGKEVSTYREGNDDFDITVQLSEKDRNSIDSLRQLLIPGPEGILIPLTSLAKIEYAGLLGDVHRVNNERVVTVKANVDETKIPGPVARGQAEERLADFPLPDGYHIRFTGEREEQEEAEAFLSKAFFIGLLLIGLILITQFNSLAQPLIILSSVLLSLGGVFLGLALMDMSFGVIMTGVGIISLAGVVVNNAIVLVDYINQLRKRGFAVYEAIVAAGCTRLRPIILTAVTTILGLLPMLTGISVDFHEMVWKTASESSQHWRSMASAVIFGLMVATAVNLIIVPVIYSLIHSSSHSLDRLLSKESK